MRGPPEQRCRPGLNTVGERQGVPSRVLELVEHHRRQSRHPVADRLEFQRAALQTVRDVLEREDHLLRLGRGSARIIDPESNLARELFEAILDAPRRDGSRHHGEGYYYNAYLGNRAPVLP